MLTLNEGENGVITVNYPKNVIFQQPMNKTGFQNMLWIGLDFLLGMMSLDWNWNLTAFMKKTLPKAQWTHGIEYFE